MRALLGAGSGHALRHKPARRDRGMSSPEGKRQDSADRFFKRPFSFLTAPKTRQNRWNRGGAQRPKRLHLSLDAGCELLGVDSPAQPSRTGRWCAQFASHSAGPASWAAGSGSCGTTCGATSARIFGVGGENAVEANEVKTWPWQQRRQPLHELQRQHDQMRRPVAPGGLKLQRALSGGVWSARARWLRIGSSNGHFFLPDGTRNTAEPGGTGAEHIARSA